MGNTDNKQSRKWQLTINNPEENGLSREVMIEILGQLTTVDYYCISDEIASTPHTHIYLHSKSALRFTTIKGRFPAAHIEPAKGTSEENRAYVFKEGKWLTDEKRETNLPDTHLEWGELPTERQGARNDLAELYEMIKEGASDYEILETKPEYFNQINRMEKVRQTIYEERYKREFRKLEVTYIWGETGSGKTRTIMEAYGYENVFRITNYKNPFDLYKMQDVIVFDEFRSSLVLADMLNYLDGYPLSLPCRYNDKIACYTKVFIISNIDLRKQYEDIQDYEQESWRAFLRRIQKVRVYTKESVMEYETQEYMKGFTPIIGSEETPFEKG